MDIYLSRKWLHCKIYIYIYIDRHFQYLRLELQHSQILNFENEKFSGYSSRFKKKKKVDLNDKRTHYIDTLKQFIQ